MKVTISQIPEFLKSSKFYESLSELDKDSSFDIQDEFFKESIIIDTDDDLISYIKMFDYWMMETIPNEFYKYILKNKNKIDIDFLLDQFPMNDLVKQINIIIETPKIKWCSYFSSKGNLELLKYYFENGCPLSQLACVTAAKYGHLNCLKYAFENGGYWDQDTCNAAAYNGHLECLKYAHEKLYIFLKKYIILLFK